MTEIQDSCIFCGTLETLYKPQNKPGGKRGSKAKRYLANELQESLIFLQTLETLQKQLKYRPLNNQKQMKRMNKMRELQPLDSNKQVKVK